MLGGSTADRLGRARVFKLGLALFTAYRRWPAASPRASAGSIAST